MVFRRPSCATFTRSSSSSSRNAVVSFSLSRIGPSRCASRVGTRCVRSRRQYSISQLSSRAASASSAGSASSPKKRRGFVQVPCRDSACPLESIQRRLRRPPPRTSGTVPPAVPRCRRICLPRPARRKARRRWIVRSRWHRDTPPMPLSLPGSGAAWAGSVRRPRQWEQVDPESRQCADGMRQGAASSHGCVGEWRVPLGRFRPRHKEAGKESGATRQRPGSGEEFAQGRFLNLQGHGQPRTAHGEGFR